MNADVWCDLCKRHFDFDHSAGGAHGVGAEFGLYGELLAERAACDQMIRYPSPAVYEAAHAAVNRITDGIPRWIITVAVNAALSHIIRHRALEADPLHTDNDPA